MAVGMCHQLIALLRSRIEADGMSNTVVLGEGHLAVQSIDTAGRCIYQMRNVVMAASLQDI